MIEIIHISSRGRRLRTIMIQPRVVPVESRPQRSTETESLHRSRTYDSRTRGHRSRRNAGRSPRTYRDFN
jgi:hypothetical protein